MIPETGEAERETHRQCQRCGTAVSAKFVRVFGQEGYVHGCLDCMSRRLLSAGYGASPDSEPGEVGPLQEPPN